MKLNGCKRPVMRAYRVLLCGIFFNGSVFAQENFAAPSNFQVLQPCAGYASIKRQTGKVDLTPQQTYAAHAENKPANATHVLVSVGNGKKWISVACGQYIGGKPAFKNQVNNHPVALSACLPFFDNIRNQVNVGVGGNVDVTPQAPVLEPFGKALNQMCGEPGKVTTKTAFKQLLTDHPNVLTELMQFTGHRVFPNTKIHTNQALYLDDLAEAWYSIQAFDHIFCGEPTAADKIGGLHFHGRYLQLQNDQQACRLPNYAQNEVIPGIIYTLGVRMQRADGSWAQSPTKGYGLTLSAADILKVVTKAFAQNPTSSNSSQACILRVTDGGMQFDTVFVRRSNGIRTFYPDATPDTDRDSACAKRIVLD